MLNPNNYESYQDFLKAMTKNFNLDNPAPFVSARSWSLFNIDIGELMFAK